MHRGEKHQLVALGDLNMVPNKTVHSSGSLEESTMRTFQRLMDDHELENALLTRISEPCSHRRNGTISARRFPRVQQEITIIKEGLREECDQETLSALFDRFLKIGTPKAATKEHATRSDRQGPLYHILHNMLGQLSLRAGNAYVRRCLQRAELLGGDRGQAT
jgi:hypothetical protein